MKNWDKISLTSKVARTKSKNMSQTNSSSDPQHAVSITDCDTGEVCLYLIIPYYR